MNLSSSKFNIIIKKNLKKYNKSIKKNYIWKINNLVFHKKCHFTSIFIEYLILDDIQEFLLEEYPLIYSYINIPFFSKYLIPKIIFSFILDECGRNLILKNIKKKKALLYTYLIEAKRKLQELIDKRDAAQKELNAIKLDNSIDGDSAFEKFSEALKCMDNDSAKFLLNLFSPINCRSLLIFSFILQTFNLMLVDIVNMDLDGIAKRLETIQSNLDILQSAFTNQFVKHDEGGLSLSVSDSALSDYTMSSEFAFRNIILQKLPPSIQAAVQ